METIQDYLAILGCKVRDRVTDFRGVVESVGFDLYGCVQCVVKPALDEKGDVRDGRWFDIHRLEVLDKAPVMAQPKFIVGYEKGPADKPLPR